MYEYRTDNNPTAMPMGDDVISRHRTVTAAHAAMARELRRFAAGPYSTGGSYLARIVVHVTPDKSAHLVGDCLDCLLPETEITGHADRIEGAADGSFSDEEAARVQRAADLLYPGVTFDSPDELNTAVAGNGSADVSNRIDWEFLITMDPGDLDQLVTRLEG